MKLSEVLKFFWDNVNTKTLNNKENKEQVKLFQKLYIEVLAIEKEGKDFNDT